MKQEQRRASGTLHLIEEATHLMRGVSVQTLATYYLGTIPFVIGFLYFWADMSRSPFAEQHLSEASLAITGLFLWMKFCQAAFGCRLRAHLSLEPMPAWSFGKGVRMFLRQAIIQPIGLFILPAAFVCALPFAWVYAFFQNATVLERPESNDATQLVKKAWRQASLWPGQNHLALTVASGFALCIFIDLAVAAFSLPALAQSLFGFESTFARSPLAMLNTTFFAAICALTYLCVDPLMKAVYALRCFYGESLHSGADLKAGLKRAAVAAIVILSLALLLPAASQQVSTEALDRSIDGVIHEAKYTWRMPRNSVAPLESDKGVITRFLERAGGFIRDEVKALLRYIGRLIEQLFIRNGGRTGGTSFGAMPSVLLYVLLAIVLAGLAVILIRARRAPPAALVVAKEIERHPDIRDESVGPDQMPEDGWTRLARELYEKGEFRLAMRAFYLASLAHLADRNLIRLARFKSNRDYESDLRRRAHAVPDLLGVFQDNVLSFERIWYGSHSADRELVERFAANVARIKGVA
jgi:hypothetical protein